MIIGASLFFQSEEDLQRLQKIKGMEIQLGFFRLKYLELFLAKDYIKYFDKANIKIVSIHAPNFKIHSGTKHAMEILDKCKSLMCKTDYELSLITLHPQKSPEPEHNALKDINYWGEKNNTFICWEMFPPWRGVWCRTPFQLYELAQKYPSFMMTFDTSHASDEYWLHPNTWDFIYDKVGVLHFSVKPKTPIIGSLMSNGKHQIVREHCYIDYEDPMYDYKSFWDYVCKSRWDGQVFIEYMPQYDSHLRPDVYALKEIKNLAI